MSSLLNSIDFQYVIGALVKIAIFWIFIMLVVAYTVYAERRVLAVIQNRLGPNRVGWQGLLQPFADLLKFIFKEDIIPLAVNKWLYILAPIIVLIPAMMVLIVYPFGPGDVPLPFGAAISQTLNDLGARFGMTWNIDLSTINLYVTNMNVGLLYVFAMTSLGIYGIVIGGWASNSKYSLLGGLRSSAQMISYELALSLSVIAVLIQARHARSGQDSRAAAGLVSGLQWNIFQWPMFLPCIIAFFIYLISAIAETNRVPFDLPEAETELVAGFHTEYSSLKFALFFMAEYVNMMTVSVLATTLFLGGWNGPGVETYPVAGPCLVSGESILLPVPLHLVARDAAAFPLRPVDGFRVEGAVAGGALQHRPGFGHRSLVLVESVMEFSHILFLGLAALAVVAAFNVILQRNPIYSAIGLIVVLGSLAALFLTLSAQFIAAMQIIVYAGAIMVLFVFVIMLLNVRAEETRMDKQKYLKWLAAPLFLALLAEVMAVVRYVNLTPQPLPSANSAADPEKVLGHGRKHRLRDVHRLPDPVRGRVDTDPDGDRRLDAACAPRKQGRRRTHREGAGRAARGRTEIRRGGRRLNGS